MKRWQSILALLAACGAAAFLIFHGASSANVLHVHAQLDRARHQLAEVSQANQVLREKITALHDPAYIARLAHRQLGMIKPGQRAYEIVKSP
jgi:cell division protein FtsB